MSNGLVVIVGVGPGVSASVAKKFAAKGHPLLLVARNEAKLADMKTALSAEGAQVDYKVVDASKPGEVANVISAITEPVASVVYNAAAWGGSLLTSEDADIRTATETNLYSIIATAKAAAPKLQASNGVLFITGGGFALYPSAAYGILSVGKAMTRTTSLLLAEELKPQGVRVHTITIMGTVAPGTGFDPDLIADTYMQVFEDPASPIETVFKAKVKA